MPLPLLGYVTALVRAFGATGKKHENDHIVYYRADRLYSRLWEAYSDSRLCWEDFSQLRRDLAKAVESKNCRQLAPFPSLQDTDR